jgi:hypothetical protein
LSLDRAAQQREQEAQRRAEEERQQAERAWREANAEDIRPRIPRAADLEAAAGGAR